MEAPFSNRGTVNVNSGSLILKGGDSVTHTGTFNHKSPFADITFRTGSHTLTSTSVISNGTGIYFNGATTKIYGTFTPKLFYQVCYQCAAIEILQWAGETYFYVPFSTNLPISMQGGNIYFNSNFSSSSSVTILDGYTFFYSNAFLNSLNFTGGYFCPAGVVSISSSFAWNGVMSSCVCKHFVNMF